MVIPITQEEIVKIRVLVSVCLLSVCLLFISLSVRPYLDFSEVLRFARNSPRGNSMICKNDKKTIHAGFSYRRKVLGEGGLPNVHP